MKRLIFFLFYSLFLIVIVIISMKYCNNTPRYKEINSSDSTLHFSQESFKLDKRIISFLNEYFNDNLLQNKNDFIIGFDCKDDTTYISVNLVKDMFGLFTSEPHAIIQWGSRKIYVVFNFDYLLINKYNSIKDSMLSCNIQGNVNKIWLLVMPIYSDTSMILKDRRKINEILRKKSKIQIVSDN